MSDHGEAKAISRRGRPRMSLNLTPMIDVVFQLLVYFLVSTNFARGEQVYRVDLPSRSDGAAADPFTLDQEPLRIEIAPAGDGLVTIRIPGPWPQPADFEALFEFLDGRRLDGENPAGLFAVDHPIVIDPAPSVRWDRTVDAFNAAVRAGYERVSFAESKP
ncbi:MAG: ExbD/TolR family protein [Phycisphaerales bacterium]|jgi:biopolymer transport protein ExbD